MIAARRGARAHHEFRFGAREALALGAASCLVAGAIFAAGVLVGRGAGPSGALRSPAGREAAASSEAAESAEGTGKASAARAEEKLTFYKTLTAPTADLPPVGKPKIEEHLVPRDEEPATASAVTAPAPAAGEAEVPERRPGPPRREPPSTARAPVPTRVARVAPAPRPAPAAVTAPAHVPDLPWTVQVSAFRSRTLADELRNRLAARGFDVHVFASTTEDGRARYRVRVGAYASRGEAERVAGDLRSERGLNPIVTSRSR
jgi:cell division protein FtsN